MGFKDDYEYYDDDDYDEEDDEEYLDYSDSSSSSARNNISPYNKGKGGLPGSGTSRFGGRIGARSDDDDDDDDDSIASRLGTNRFSSSSDKEDDKGSSNRFGSGSRFGSSSSDKDDEDDKGSSNRFGSGNRFSSGSRFGSSSSDKGDEDDKGSSNRFGSGNRFSSGSRFGSSSSDKDDEDDGGSTNRFSSGSRFSSGKKEDEKKSSSRYGSNSNRFSSGSSKKEDEKKSSSRYGSSSKKEDEKKSSGRFSSSKKEDEKKSSSRFGSSSKKEDEKKSSGRFGSSRFSSSKKDDGKKSSTTKKDEKSGGGMFGGIRNRFSSGDKADDKKDNKKDNKSGGGASLGGLLGSNKGDKSDSKKDDKSGGGMFGGIRNRFGSGDKADDKKDSKKDNKSDNTKASGGRFGNRLGSQSAAKKDSGDSKKSSRFGSNRFGSQSTDKKDDKKDDSRTSSSQSSRFGSNRFSSQSANKADNRKDDKKDEGGKKPQSAFGRFGRSKDDKSDDKSGKSSTGRTKASTKDSEASGGVFGRISASVGGILGRGESKSTATRSRSKKSTSKVPQASSEDGLTLDNWLDIFGVALVFGSLVLFFSAISRDQAAISRVHIATGQLFGWGALAVPIVMFVVGMWLIIRHFGDDAPTVDPIRIAGIVLGFISLLVIFQYIDSFGYEDIYVPNNGAITQQMLESRLYQAWYFDQSGGGIVGAQIYYFLVTSVTELGGFLLNIFVMLISAMLITRLSAAEILTAIAGVGLSLREWTQQEAERRRAERKMAAQKAAEIAYQQQMGVPQPQTEAVPAPAYAAAAQAEVPADDREIRINLGGQAMQAPNVAGNVPQPVMQQPQATPAASSGGLFSRFRGGNKANTANTTNQGNGTIAAAVGSLFSMGGNNSDVENTGIPSVPPLPHAPLPMDDGYSHLDSHPPHPAASTSNPNTIKLGDLLKPPPTPTAKPENPTTAYASNDVQQATPPPAQQQPAATAIPITDAPEEVDPIKARQERLNALRQGKAGPLSQAAMAQARKEDTPETRGIPIGRDTKTPPVVASAEFTPPSQLPSVQPDGDTGLRQQRLSQPISSPVSNQTRPQADWRLPDYRTLLSSGSEQEFDREYLLKQAKIIEETLAAFGAPGRVVEVNTGPVITQFGVEPDYMQGRSGKKQRVKVGAIAGLDKDLQLALGARSIRVEAPVPGKGYVGIEVPNAEATLVSLRDVMDSPSFAKHKSPLGIALGQSVSGAPISADLANMPHLLIAGTTGSGKSVCVNSIIASILALNTPDVVKFIMVDPKRVELTGYNGIPHLVAPVVVELERIIGVLKWVTREMDERYKKFSEAGARNIEDYNKHRDPTIVERMPYIIVIIDELADLMMLAPEETERTITRIAALARATGIHLVIATQRPSVDVVTGLIKANFPARIAFAVAGGVDSRVILDQPGAERLLGKGDMLYLSGDSPAPLRLQGVFVSDMESNNIVRYWKMQSLKQPEPQPISLNPTYKPANSSRNVKSHGTDVKQQAFWDSSNSPNPAAVARPAASFDGFDDTDTYEGDLTQGELTGDVEDGTEDELYEKSVELVRRLDKASISLLQRRLRIGYTRAARLIDVMEARRVIGPAKDGSSKPRDVLPDR